MSAAAGHGSDADDSGADSGAAVVQQPTRRKRPATVNTRMVPTRLSELGIRSFDLEDLGGPPVMVIHAPRETGGTTLLGSLLLQAQAALDLEGVVVLCDRPTATYMGGVVPRDVVMNIDPAKALSKLIAMQQHRKSHMKDRPLPRLALVVDDAIYTPKVLKAEAFQRDLKQAKDFNIMVLLSTTDAELLPKNVPTFATHVMATKSVSTMDSKVLQRRMFVMFDSSNALTEMLALCQPFEYLIGLLRPTTGSQISDKTRRYTPTHYVRDDSFADGGANKWKGEAPDRARGRGRGRGRASGPAGPGASDEDEDEDDDYDDDKHDEDHEATVRALAGNAATAMPKIGSFHMSDEMIVLLTREMAGV